MTDFIELLSSLTAELSTAVAHLEGLSPRTAKNPDVIIASRKLCLASRAAFSEFRALEIENSPLFSSNHDLLQDLISLHQEALKVLESISDAEPQTVEFAKWVGNRLDALTKSRTRFLLRQPITVL